MLKKFKSNIKDEKLLFSNISSLASMQVFKFVLPMITFPYIVSVIGVAKFGEFSYMQAIMFYFILINAYSFNITGTKLVALNKLNKSKLAEIFYEIMSVKFLLLAFNLVCFIVLLIFLDLNSLSFKLYVFGFLGVIGAGIFPEFYFQGTQQLKIVSKLFLVNKIIYSILVIVILREPEDYIFIPLISGVLDVLIGLYSLFLVFFKDKLSFALPKYKNILKHFIEGFPIFISKISISFYTTSTTIFLGIWSNEVAVGLFNIAYKVIKIGLSIYPPITQALFPRIIELRVDNNLNASNKLIKKFTIISFLFGFFSLITITLLGKYLLITFLGQEAEEAYYPLLILSSLLVIIPYASMLFNVKYLVQDLESKLVFVYSLGALFHILLMLLLMKKLDMDIYGACYSVCLTEIFIITIGEFLYRKLNHKSTAKIG